MSAQDESRRSKIAAEPFRRWRNRLTRSVLDALFPADCQICGSEDGPFCSDCRMELLGQGLRFCPRCAAATGPFENLRDGCSGCRGRRLGFDAATALGPYQGPIRRLCLMIKKERNAWLAGRLADLLVEARGRVLREQDADYVVAVPLHWRRRWSRGFDQATELAKTVAKRLNLKFDRFLARVEDTAPLAGLGREERFRRLRHAFRLRKGIELRGKTILLVDDILTTGATCGAAARELKRAGARRVFVAVIGRADKTKRAGSG